jgi:hypothetical protein
MAMYHSRYAELTANISSPCCQTDWAIAFGSDDETTIRRFRQVRRRLVRIVRLWWREESERTGVATDLWPSSGIADSSRSAAEHPCQTEPRHCFAARWPRGPECLGDPGAVGIPTALSVRRCASPHCEALTFTFGRSVLTAFSRPAHDGLSVGALQILGLSVTAHADSGRRSPHLRSCGHERFNDRRADPGRGR